MFTEAQLAEGCRNNKPAYQKALYEKYGRLMLSVCMRYIPDRMKAEDVFQEAFVKVFKSFDQYKDQGSLEGWMRRIFVRYSINYYQRHYKKYLESTIELEDNELKYHTADALDDLSYEELCKLIDELPEGCRLVFKLFAIEGFNHLEIAEALQVSEGTSKSQLSRARQLLKHKISLSNH